MSLTSLKAGIAHDAIESLLEMYLNNLELLEVVCERGHHFGWIVANQEPAVISQEVHDVQDVGPVLGRCHGLEDGRLRHAAELELLQVEENELDAQLVLLDYGRDCGLLWLRWAFALGLVLVKVVGVPDIFDADLFQEELREGKSHEFGKKRLLGATWSCWQFVMSIIPGY